jgi:hypothetical protein
VPVFVWMRTNSKYVGMNFSAKITISLLILPVFFFFFFYALKMICDAKNIDILAHIEALLFVTCDVRRCTKHFPICEIDMYTCIHKAALLKNYFM